jgi:hypothetical protein
VFNQKMKKQQHFLKLVAEEIKKGYNGTHGTELA